jgi:hypothetical protein
MYLLHITQYLTSPGPQLRSGCRQAPIMKGIYLADYYEETAHDNNENKIHTT